MTAPVPLVTLQVCEVRAADVPRLLVTTTTWVRRERSDPAVLVAKLLGTTGRRFVPRDVRPTRWALLTCRADGRPATPWNPRGATETARLQLRPLSSRGTWDGIDPFPAKDDTEHHGSIAVLTRASLRATKARAFYRAVPGIAREVGHAHGLVAAFGFGEAPLLRQGTFSIWESAQALASFHRAARHHPTAIRRTPEIGWYAEELFARLAVVAATGDIDGQPVAA